LAADDPILRGQRETLNLHTVCVNNVTPGRRCAHPRPFPGPGAQPENGRPGITLIARGLLIGINFLTTGVGDIFSRAFNP
jgi:hypothetical protein